MTTRPIVYEISVDGADRTQTAFNGIAQSEDRANAAHARMRQGLQQGNQAFDALNQIVGHVSPQLGSMIGIVTQVGHAFVALEAAAGPIGIVLVAISTAITVLGPLMSDAADDADDLSTSFDNVRESARELAESSNALYPILERLRLERRRAALEGQEETPEVRAQLAALREAVATEQANRNRVLAGGEGPQELAARLAAEEEANQRLTQDDIAVAAANEERGRRAGEAYAAAYQEAMQRSQQEDQEVAALQEAERERIELEGINRRNAIERQDQADKVQLVERHIEQELAARERLDQELERYHAAELARVREQAQAHQRLSQEIQGYAQPLVSGFVGAMSKVIAGTESAGDAFKGLLSSFLEFISQQAALKAAFEFAEAAANFASFNYGGALGHIAAGVAFTGVAIAAGAGAIATAPSAASPASPAANQAPQQSGGNTYNINWNSPVITAQDNAELGRTLNQTLSRSNSRFASSV